MMTKRFRLGEREEKMLVLSRKPSEIIKIGNDIEITVVDIRDGKVRIGISAPPNISVHRKEIYDAIQRKRMEGREKRESKKLQ